MADCMEFPKDWAKFLEDYSFCDHKEFYTNGARLIPVFRVEQMMHHYLRKATDDSVPRGVTVQEWIPVTERLPEGMDWVLCACKDGEVRILCYDYIMDDWDIHGRPNSCYGKAFVTHWMPLPEPPKGE